MIKKKLKRSYSIEVIQARARLKLLEKEFQKIMQEEWEIEKHVVIKGVEL